MVLLSCNLDGLTVVTVPICKHSCEVFITNFQLYLLAEPPPPPSHFQDLR
jgi:hypothetical protein